MSNQNHIYTIYTYWILLIQKNIWVNNFKKRPFYQWQPLCMSPIVCPLLCMSCCLWRLKSTCLNYFSVLSVPLSVVLSCCPTVCPIVCHVVCRGVGVSVCPIACSVVCHGVCLSVFVSCCVSVCLSCCLSVCPTVCLSVHPSIKSTLVQISRKLADYVKK